MNSAGKWDFDAWKFERTYNHLFALEVESQSSKEDNWRFDPFDSKYPTVDGILRRTTKIAAHLGDKYQRYKEQFILVQLKGTQYQPGHDPHRSLKQYFSAGDPNPIQEINAVAATCRALLIGLSIDMTKPSLEGVYFAAPSAYLSAAKLTEKQRVDPSDLVRTMAKLLDAVDPQLAPPTAAPTMGAQLKPVIFPRAQEIIYFNKQQGGTLSVADGGIIQGRNICMNWTLPRLIRSLSVHTIKGAPEIEAIPVRLPYPPYDAIAQHVQQVSAEGWTVPQKLTDIDTFWWVLQVRFINREATIKVEARP